MEQKKKGNPFTEVTKQCPVCGKIDCSSLECFKDMRKWTAEIDRHSKQGEWMV